MAVQVAQWAGPSDAGPPPPPPPEPRPRYGCCRAPGRGRRPSCGALHGTDREKPGGEEVHADEPQLPGACPAGLLRQLGGELHGVPGPGLGLRRASEAEPGSHGLRAAPTPSLAPLPVKPSRPPPTPAFLSLEPPPAKPSSLAAPPPNFLRCRSSLRAALALNLGHLPHPLGPGGWSFSPPTHPAPRHQQESHQHPQRSPVPTRTLT